MTSIARGSLAWVGMVLAGLALGAYVVAAWPDTTPRIVRLPYGESMPKTPVAGGSELRVTASADAYPELELAGVAGAAYPVELFAYELTPAPLLEAIISAPQTVDAH